MNYMPAIGAHNKDRTATKRVFCRNTKTTHPKRGIPPGKTCILTKTYFLPHIPADDYGRYLALNGICPAPSRNSATVINKSISSTVTNLVRRQSPMYSTEQGKGKTSRKQKATSR